MQEILQHCQSLPEEHIGEGEIILAEGEKSGLIYILIEGDVVILKRDVTITRISDPGAILGEISALLDIPHTATVKTMTACRFYKIENHPDFLGTHSEFCYPLAVMLARRVHSVTNYLADIKEQYQDRDDHLGMMDEILETLVNQQGDEEVSGSDRDPF